MGLGRGRLALASRQGDTYIKETGRAREAGYQLVPVRSRSCPRALAPQQISDRTLGDSQTPL